MERGVTERADMAERGPGRGLSMVHRLWVTVVSALAGVGLATVLWHAVPLAWQAVKTHPYFAVSSIVVHGHLRLDREEVLRWAEVADGMSIWDASPAAVRLRVQRSPWVEQAQVRREFPNYVSIRIQERRPVALAQLDELTYVDRRGRLLGPLRTDDSRDFVVVTGLQHAEEEFAQIGLHRALELLRLCERMACFDAMSELHVDRHRGVTLFPVHQSVSVVLGWGGWREKLARATRVLAAWQEQIDRLAVVDVSFRNLVVVRLRDDGRPTAQPAAKRGMRV
jgi:cell division septal protein FtsQ